MSGVNDQAGGSATRILVANQQELDAALAAATGGETIALLSGEYASIRLWSRDFDSDVRLVSADPDAPATITGDIRVSSVSNFSIEGVDLIGDAPLAAYGSRITIQDSSNVRVADMTLTGTVPDSGVDPNDPSLSPIEALRGMPHEYGVKITGSTGVTLDALDITTMYKGVIVDKSADIAITNSEFHDLRSDGVNFVDTSDLRIEGNYFHDFTPWLNQGNGTGDHPDFIQYWGAPGGAGIDGVVIRDNIMLQGEGDLVQSIFGHFGPRGADSDPFTNFEVSGNFIQTNHVHGIALGDVSGGQIFGNVLIPSGMDIASPGDGGWRPSIHLTSLGDAGASDIEIFDNVITLSWRPVFDPTGQGEEANADIGVVYRDNTVLEQGKVVPAHWAELDLPDPSDFADAAAWMEAARIQIGVDEAPEPAQPDPAPTPEPPATPEPPEDLMLSGTDGDDELIGGDGDDTLNGLGGDDDLTGGAGADLFVIEDQAAGARTHIRDIDFAGGDRIAIDGSEHPIESLDDLFAFALNDDVRLASGGDADMRLEIDRAGGAQTIDITFAGEDRSDADFTSSMAADSVEIQAGATALVDVLANDALGDDAFLAGHAASALGSRVEIVDGQIHYEAAELPMGVRAATDTILYTVSDGRGGKGTAELEITLNAVGPVTHQDGDGNDDQAGGSATRILVANQQELDAALAAATGGETIALLSGEYASIRLWSRDFDSDVRLVSADPDAPATITGDIRVSSVSNFSIEGVDLIGDAPLAAYGSRITIQDSSNVRVADMTLTGTVPDSGVDPNDPSLSPIEALRGMPHEYGVKITGSTGVTLDALDITTMYKGVIVDKSADIAITNSEFHDLRSDGVNFVDTSDLRIEGNYFHDFTPWLNQGNGTGDHPDFIQYWGAPGGAGIDGVVIRDNIMLQGEGDLVQSIFGHFGPRGADSDPFTNFEVSGNFIQTNHVHGIALGDVSGGQIFGNVLIPSGMDIASPGDGGWRPSIHLTSLGDAGASDIEIFDNVITLSWRPVFDPTGQGEEANADIGVVYRDNTVLEQGKVVPAHWAELDLPDPSDFADAAAWMEAARIQIGVDEAPEPAQPDPAPTPEPPATPEPPEDLMLSGTDGDDELIGGDGDDTLNGLGGDDDLTGGAGADLFVIEDQAAGARTHIRDIDFAGGDRIAIDGSEHPIESLDDLFAFALNDDVRLASGGDADMRLEIDRAGGAQTIDITFAGEDRSDADFTSSMAADSVEIQAGATALVDVLANDALGDDAFLAGHAASALGSRVEIVDGQIHYEAAELPMGVRAATDTILYTVSDGRGGKGTAELEITLNAVGPVTHQGGDGNDNLATPHSDDVVIGGAGDDVLYTRGGDDWLEGGAGDDRLTGNQGSDTMIGGDGADNFVFYGAHIEDGDRDLVVDLNFAEHDRFTFAHFEPGVFAERMSDGSYSGVQPWIRSVEDLLSLEQVEGFSLQRLDEAHALIEIEIDAATTGEIEIVLTGASAGEFEALWFAA